MITKLLMTKMILSVYFMMLWKGKEMKMPEYLVTINRVLDSKKVGFNSPLTKSDLDAGSLV